MYSTHHSSNFLKKRLAVIFFIFFVFFIGLPFTASAQDDVNKEELLQHQGSVEFINNNRMPSRIDSRSSILSIGRGLGRAIGRGENRAGDSRYFVVHCVSEDETGKFNADVLGLGEGAGVDHIRNLRLIVQGYLESAYHYTPADAALLAQYITIYNAVFRKNLDYFSLHYKKLVISNLTADKVGLSTRFSEWAGQTLMVIPLGNAEAGSLSAVNTTPLTDPQVVDEMRKDPDKGIDSRKDMVDLKEREASEAEKKAESQKKDAEKEAASINEDRKKLDQDNKVQSSGDKKEESVSKEEINKREDAVAQQKEEAKKNQELAEKKTAEAQQERKDIAKDQQELANSEIPKKQTPVLGMALNNANSPLGKIVQMDKTSGAAVNSSAIATLNIRTVQLVDNSFIALASQKDSSYRLVKIDPSTLETIEQGEDIIGANSFLWVNNKDIYAIAASDAKSFAIARFDADLKLQAKSTVAAHPFASVFFSEKRLMTQRSDGTTLFLNPQDLTELPLSGQ